MSPVSFFVPGVPRAQGSKRHVGHGRMIESSPHIGNWRSTVSLAAGSVMAGSAPLSGPMRVRATFMFPRPKGHYLKSGELKVHAPTRPIGRVGDLDKLLRALFDAITGIVFVDDAQVVIVSADKAYSDAPAVPGVSVEVFDWSKEVSGGH